MSYQIYFVNHGYFSQEIFNTLEAASNRSGGAAGTKRLIKEISELKEGAK